MEQFQCKLASFCLEPDASITLHKRKLSSLLSKPQFLRHVWFWVPLLVFKRIKNNCCRNYCVVFDAVIEITHWTCVEHDTHSKLISDVNIVNIVLSFTKSGGEKERTSSDATLWGLSHWLPTNVLIVSQICCVFSGQFPHPHCGGGCHLCDRSSGKRSVTLCTEQGIQTRFLPQCPQNILFARPW